MSVFLGRVLFWFIFWCNCKSDAPASLSSTGLPSVRRTIWNFRRKCSCFRSRTCKKVFRCCCIHSIMSSVTPPVTSGSNRSLIDQLKKLQAVVKISTMKTSTTSTCVMVQLPCSVDAALPFLSFTCGSLASRLSSVISPLGIPALVLSHHLPISQSVCQEHGAEGSLHSLLQ